MVQAYYALREQVGVEGQKPLKTQILSFLIATRAACGLPPVQPDQDQSDIPLPPAAANCVADAYDREHDAWAAQLRGPAITEAARSPENNIALQQELQVLGFLPKDASIDGIFGTGTRSALRAWQTKSGMPPTGFFGFPEAYGLSEASGRNLDDPYAKLRSNPLAQADFKGSSVTLTAGDLQATMNVETVTDPAVCENPHSGFMDLYDSSEPHHTPCRAMMLKLSESGTVTFSATAGLLDPQTTIDSLLIKIAIRWLDKSTAQPQITVSEYSGGAHCCTDTVALTQQVPGGWQRVMLGQVDGDSGFNYLDLSKNNYALLVDTAPDFDYHFSSYAGSVAPTRIRRLVGVTVQDVTTDGRYREFLLARLKHKENAYNASEKAEPNGFLAGWVAQKALVGQFDEAWRTMLTSYSHERDFSVTTCLIDKHAWPKGMSRSLLKLAKPAPLDRDVMRQRSAVQERA